MTRDQAAGPMRWALALAAALVLTVGVGPMAAAGREPRPGVPVHRQDPGDAPALEMASQTAFVEATGTFELLLRAPNAPDGARLRVSVHPSVAIRGRLRFEDTIGGRSLGAPLLSLPPIDVRAAEEFLGQLGLAIPVVPEGPAPAGGVVLGTTGVYPVAVELETAEGDPLDSFVTYLVRLPDPADPADPADEATPALAFATVVPFEAPPALRSDRTWRVADADLDRLGGTAAALAATPEPPLTLPALPETLSALGEVSGGDAVLADLRAALPGRQVATQPWVPIDVGSWAAAELDAALADELTAGSLATERALGQRPTLGTTVLDPTVDPVGLGLLHDLGTTSVVVPEDLLEPLDSEVFRTTLTQPFGVVAADGQVVSAISADRGLASHLTVTDDPVLAAHLVLADLAVLRLDLEGVERGAALIVPSDADVDFLTTLLEGLAEPHDRPLVRAVTVDDLLATVPPATTRGNGSDSSAASGGDPLVRAWRYDEPSRLGRYPIERQATEEGLDGYRSLVGEESDRWVPLETLVQSSGDRRLESNEQNELLLTVQGLIGDEISRIHAPDGQSITLTAEESTLPLVLENDLDIPVRVRIALESDRLEFPDGDAVDSLLQPGTNRIEVRVRSRASGAFPLDVTVTSPDEVLELDDTRVTVRSTAISGLGVVLSLAAGAFLAIWWIRHWRTTRRDRRLVSAAHPSTGTPSTEGRAATSAAVAGGAAAGDPD